MNALPVGVHIVPCPVSDDARGSLVEIFSAQRAPAAAPQWNLVRSQPGTLRGMHVHLDRDDYIAMLQGRMLLGLKDLRGDSTSFGRTALVELDASTAQAAIIPVGVLHGFLFPEGGLHVYGLSAYWRPDTDIGCRWDDPELGLLWPCAEPIVIERDLQLGSLRALLEREPGFATMGAQTCL